jgi:hypothetical protein
MSHRADDLKNAIARREDLRAVPDDQRADEQLYLAHREVDGTGALVPRDHDFLGRIGLVLGHRFEPAELHVVVDVWRHVGDDDVTAIIGRPLRDAG